MLPVIAIVGRPNAGKSTLFNRLTRTQRALVDAEPGVTRDRNIAEVVYDERRFLLVDTGGLDAEATGDFAAEVREQSAVAIAEADAIVFVVDGRAGLAPGDRDVLDRLRRGGKPFWLAVNKLDTPALDGDAAEFFALGVERVLPISTAHGRGVGELMEQVLASLGREEGDEGGEGGADEAVSVAIIGRPNVGKSSLMNRLVGFERAIVTPIPGTTRDAIDTPFTFNGKAYVLVDTAGIRRRPRVHERVERGSVTRSLRALERSEVGVLVVDAVEGMTDQDARIASYAWERGRALVIVVNKCDLAGGVRRMAKTMEAEVARLYPTLADVPVLCTSAVTGEQVQRILRLVERVAQNHRRELPTPSLNQVVTAATRATAPPSVRGKRPTFQYAVQTGKRPPRITIFCSAPQLVTEAYTRYLVNRLREAFPLTGTPVRIAYRARREERPGRGRKR